MSVAVYCAAESTCCIIAKYAIQEGEFGIAVVAVVVRCAAVVCAIITQYAITDGRLAIEGCDSTVIVNTASVARVSTTRDGKTV